MKLFDLDGPIQKYGTIIFDVMVLTFLWLFISIFSLGLLGGIATIAFYYAAYHSIFETSSSSLKLFFTIFKRKIIIGTTTYLTIVFFLSLSILCIYWVSIGVIAIIWLMPVYLFLTLELLFTLTFLFPVMAHTQFTYRQSLKMSFLLAGRHLPTTVLTSAMTFFGIGLAIVLALGYVQLFPFFLIYTPVAVLSTTYLVTKRILTKYNFFVGLDD